MDVLSIGIGDIGVIMCKRSLIFQAEFPDAEPIEFRSCGLFMYGQGGISDESSIE
jgi:hypothetical protein